MRKLCWIVLNFIITLPLLVVVLSVAGIDAQPEQDNVINTMVATAPLHITLPTPIAEQYTPRTERSLVSRGGVDYRVVTEQPKPTPEPTPEPTPIPEPTCTEDDLYWLAKIVYAEAEGEPDEGQIAVANVVLNRVKYEYFPDTIKGVIFQKTGKTYQFSPCKSGGRINLEPDDRAIENAKKALEGERVLDMPENVLFFYRPTKGNKNDWIRSRDIWQTIGHHRFCF